MKKTKMTWPVVLCAVAGAGLALRLGGSLLHLAVALGIAAVGMRHPESVHDNRGGKASEG